MNIKHLLLCAITLTCSTQTYSMEQLSITHDTHQIEWLSLPTDIWIDIFARLITKDNLQNTCTYLHNLTSKNKEKILAHPNLALNEKVLETFFLYYGALGDNKIVRNLLAKGANPNAYDVSDMTVLQYAAHYGYSDIVDTLLEHPGLENKIKVDDCRSPLKLAITHHNTAIFERILSVYASDDYKELLCYVARKGLCTIVQMLLDHTIDPNYIDENGRSPLSYASEKGNLNIVKLLISKGAAVNTMQDCDSPLHWATKNCYLHVVQFLLNNNANVNAQTSHGYTPLHYASRASAQIEYEDGSMQLQEKSFIPIVTLLLNKGAQVNAGDRNSYTSLHLACENRHTNIVKILLEYHANPNAATYYNKQTPLHCATQNKHFAIMKLLLEAGADVNACTGDGYTPLHYAAKESYYPKLAILLLENGADKDAKTYDNKRPVDFLKQWQRDHPLLQSDPNDPIGCTIQ